MTKKEKTLLAVYESMAIWKEVEEKCCGKLGAINNLWNSGRLSKDGYRAGCPLCELFNPWIEGVVFIDPPHQCEDCPWPGSGFCRCLDGPPDIALYRGYLNSDMPKKIKKSAKAIYKMLKRIEIKDG